MEERNGEGGGSREMEREREGEVERNRGEKGRQMKRLRDVKCCK